ncbi:hypothetical protein G7046_g9128 [Stylonectria norvegica]|nr:hypothetical protein G7046_g9128 [Stylonectria norvegica]
MAGISTTLDADCITLTRGGLFDLVPVIRDILRTHYCVPGSIFLVEGIEKVAVSSSGRWQAVRMLLGDGVLCVQALLSGNMHRFVQAGEVALGSYIRCESFYVKWQKMADDNEDGRKMVYLVVEDLSTIGWNDSYRATQPEVPGTTFLQEKAKPESKVQSPQANLQPEKDKAVDEEVDDDFETLTLPIPKPKKTVRYASTVSKSQPIALPRDWHDPQTALKLTTLRSIPHLPYAQNWSCNVLAIVVSLSPVEPSNLPPHKQRTARIADPSTSKRVHLTVFLDPDDFSPEIGSAVLLVGVKNHRFDGGSLKKYASDKDQGQWWFMEPRHMSWCDVDGIKAWWAEMETSTAEGS